MAVTGTAEFELIPTLAKNFKVHAERLINQALGSMKLQDGDLSGKGGQLGTKLGIAFGGSMAKEIRKQVKTVRSFVISEVAGIQNEINRAASKAQIAAKLVDQGTIPSLPAAGKTVLGGPSPQQIIQDAAFVERRRQEAINQQVRAGAHRRKQIVTEAARTETAQVKTQQAIKNNVYKEAIKEAEASQKEADKRARETARTTAQENKKNAPRKRHADDPNLTRIGRFFAGIQDKVDVFTEKIGLSGRIFAQLLGAGLTGSVFVVGARLVQRALEAMGRVLVAAVVEFGKLEDSVSASNLLFGEASGKVLDFALSTERVTLSASAALKATQEFGTALQAIGLSDTGLADVSLSLAQIAEDLSSVTGVNVDTVVARLAQGAQGDVRALRSLRINIRESAVENEALRRGLKLTGIELTDSAKFASFYALVTERTKFAQGDAANTANSFNNSLAQLRKSWQNFLAILGASTARDVASMFRRLADGIQLVSILLPRILPMVKEFFRSFISSIPGMNGILGIFSLLTNKVREFNKTIVNEKAALEGALQAQADAAAKFENRNKLAEAQFEVLNRLITAELSYKQAVIANSQAILSVRQAEQALIQTRIEAQRQDLRVAEAENALAQARLAQRKSTTADESASLDLRDARLSLIEAERELADVMDPAFVLNRTIEAQLNYQQAVIESVKANRKLTESNLELEESTFDVFLATEKVIQMRRRGTSSAAEMVKAQLELAKANRQAQDAGLDASLDPLRAQKAAIDAAKAQRELSRIDTTIASERERADIANQRAIIGRIQAELGIEGALLEQTSATHAATAAQDSYNDALRTRLNFKDQVLGAELALEAAKLGAIGATHNLAVAEIEYKDALATANNEVLSQVEKFDMLMGRMRTIKDSIAPETAAAIMAIPRAIAETSSEVEATTLAVEKAFEDIRKAAEKQFLEFKSFIKDEIITWRNELIGDFAKKALGRLAIWLLESMTPGRNPATGPLKDLLGRASGGPVSAKHPYIVGERGPELFVPQASGKIMPNHQLAGNTTSITNHFSLPPTSPHILADLLTRRILRRAL